MGCTPLAPFSPRSSRFTPLAGREGRTREKGQPAAARAPRRGRPQPVPCVRRRGRAAQGPIIMVAKGDLDGDLYFTLWSPRVPRGGGGCKGWGESSGRFTAKAGKTQVFPPPISFCTLNIAIGPALCERGGRGLTRVCMAGWGGASGEGRPGGMQDGEHVAAAAAAAGGAGRGAPWGTGRSGGRPRPAQHGACTHGGARARSCGP